MRIALLRRMAAGQSVSATHRRCVCTKVPHTTPQPQSTSKPKPQPSIPDATTFFKMSNPELMLDPNSRVSWKIVGGVVLFFATYLSVTAYREGLFDPTPVEAAPQASTPALIKAEIHKVRSASPNLRAIQADCILSSLCTSPNADASRRAGTHEGWQYPETAARADNLSVTPLTASIKLAC